MKPQRVTIDQLERLAFKAGADIEVSGDTAHLSLDREYVADLPPAGGAS